MTMQELAWRVIRIKIIFPTLKAHQPTATLAL
jgi:hypothetical protein